MPRWGDWIYDPFAFVSTRQGGMELAVLSPPTHEVKEREVLMIVHSPGSLTE